jgi:beta-lactamase regulating signal transducer with metallopeptidase domain
VHAAPDPLTTGRATADETNTSSALMAWTARATSTLQQGRDAVDAAAPIWLTVWAAGVLVLALRMIGGAWWIRGLRRSSARLPERWTPVVASAMKQAGLTVPVPVRRSPRVDVPLVCGWLSPVVIVPERLLRTCPESELEALLVHELSHVRRHDVLVGWLQAGVETLLFFHPGAWWISRRIRRERELSTDDRVVGVGVSPRTYAEALTRVAEQAATLRPARGIALTPAASDGALLHRIRRVVLPAHEEPVHRASLLAATLTLLVVPLLATACSSSSRAGTRTLLPRRRRRRWSRQRSWCRAVTGARRRRAIVAAPSWWTP